MTSAVSPYQRKFDPASKRILLTGTRAPFSLELCRQFRHSGHRVYAADSISIHLARVSSYVTKGFVVPPARQKPAEFARRIDRIVEDELIDMVVPTGEEIFHLARMRPQLSCRCEWFMPSMSVLKRLHNKFEFIQWTKDLGFRTPQTELITESSQLDAIGGRIDSGEKLVLKPAFSRFSARILICPNSSEKIYSVAREASASTPWVCQEYLPGRQICCYAVGRNGQVKAYSDYATTFRVNRGTSIYFECIQHPAAYDFVSRFLRKTGFTGQIAFDFIEAQDGSVLPIECNPRTTSGVHLFRLGSGLPACFTGRPDDVIKPPVGTSAQIAVAMLAFGWMNAEQSKARWLRSLLTSRDTIFSWRDPLPLFWFAATHLRNEISARRYGISVMEAASADTEWNGEG